MLRNMLRKFLLLAVTCSVAIAAAYPSTVYARTSADVMAEIEESKVQLSDTETQLVSLQEQIDGKMAELAQIHEELDEMEEERLDQYNAMKIRIQYFYENRPDDAFYMLIANENSFADVINGMQYLQSIMDYDSQMLNNYEDLISEKAAKESELDNNIKELQDMQSEMETLKKQLGIEIDEKTEEYNELKKQENSFSYSSSDDLNLMYAIVMQECGSSYEGALAVITCACNRAQSPKWSYLGTDPLSQLTAKGQFCYSLDSHWKKYLGGNVPDHVKQAVNDALNGKRNHNYLSFRGYDNGGVNIGGNYYINPM